MIGINKSVNSISGKLINGINKGSVYIKNAQREQKQQLIKKQYNDIFEHEQAHKRAAGELGGPIVIENNAQGIPVQGHVDIKMPVLDKTNPDKTVSHAERVIKSAMAPKDPSGQDFKVAAEAQNIKSKAINEKHKQTSQTGTYPNNGQFGNFINFIA